MTLRALKRLSKRAAPMLPLLGDRREQFRARKDEAYHHVLIAARKQWDRWSCHPTYQPRNDWTVARGHEIKRLTRAGRAIVLRPPDCALKGTVMVGAVSGYYEPEYEEESAWSALQSIVFAVFTDWEADPPRPTRRLDKPSDVLRAASELVAARQIDGARAHRDVRGNA